MNKLTLLLFLVFLGSAIRSAADESFVMGTGRYLPAAETASLIAHFKKISPEFRKTYGQTLREASANRLDGARPDGKTGEASVDLIEFTRTEPIFQGPESATSGAITYLICFDGFEELPEHSEGRILKLRQREKYYKIYSLHGYFIRLERSVVPEKLKILESGAAG